MKMLESRQGGVPQGRKGGRQEQSISYDPSEMTHTVVVSLWPMRGGTGSDCQVGKRVFIDISQTFLSFFSPC